MAKIPWIDFITTHRLAHLVAAVIVPPTSTQHLRRLRLLLQHIIVEAAPAKDFATAIVRPSEVAEIHCGFADKADADRLAELADARKGTALAEWATCRSFSLDAAKEEALADALLAGRCRESRSGHVAAPANQHHASLPARPRRRRRRQPADQHQDAC